jgi:alanine-glyoxylate transaminase/serine-glyoxylate transaminase/serine-pyruvate transaminase
MTAPVLGHLDPAFVAIMDETQALLREVFSTRNKLTVPISGTGSAAMEASVVNLLEPGDELVVGIAGYFAERLAEMARRCGARVHEVRESPGSIVPPERIDEALKQHPHTKAVAVIHAETSTGACQPLTEVGQLASRHNALFIVDAVTSLGGMPVDVDANQIDVCYSCSQKCLGAPPGLAPITFSEKALRAVQERKTPVQSWYLDMTLLTKYWGKERTYHHTAPVTMNYALNAALNLAIEEGLKDRYERHQRVGTLLLDRLGEMGFRALAQAGHTLPMLIAVQCPPNIDAEVLRRTLLDKYSIEVAGGLGELRGKLLRIGLMGYGAQERHVHYLLAALAEVMKRR